MKKKKKKKQTEQSSKPTYQKTNQGKVSTRVEQTCNESAISH